MCNRSGGFARRIVSYGWSPLTRVTATFLVGDRTPVLARFRNRHAGAKDPHQVIAGALGKTEAKRSRSQYREQSTDLHDAMVLSIHGSQAVRS
jgi:hypothetical protein